MLAARAWLLVGVAAACNGDTTVLVQIAAPGLVLTSLKLDVAWGGRTRMTSLVPRGGGAPKLLGRALLLLPDISTLVEIALTGSDAARQSCVQTGEVQSRAHAQVTLAMTLDAAAP